ncbi:MAG: DMT family transporter [Clostridia bacterium]|nr:DMT family transporter [Clostridia bacterium]
MRKYTIAVLVAGCFWGLMGFFTRTLSGFGIESSGAVLLRCGVAAILFGLTILFTGPRQFLVKPRHFWCFFGSGVCSLLFFTYCYFTAISIVGLTTAAILLYSAPIIVMLLSALFFHEHITLQKVVALALACFGCFFVSGGGSVSGEQPFIGILYGFGAGLGFAMYTIFARFALNRGYSSHTVNFYSCLLAALGAAVIWGVDEPIRALASGPVCLALSLSMGAVSCYLPYLLYTYGLSGLETGRASILSSVEPVVAALVGIIIFSEPITVMGTIGILCVLGAIVLLNIKLKSKRPTA